MNDLLHDFALMAYLIEPAVQGIIKTMTDVEMNATERVLRKMFYNTEDIETIIDNFNITFDDVNRKRGIFAKKYLWTRMFLATYSP